MYPHLLYLKHTRTSNNHWTESIVPSLGITPAYQQQNSSSNHLPPVRLQRIDQREFYNGEFGGAIPVGATDICSAFFGQNAIIDYFFYIQWFTADNFDENAFLNIFKFTFRW